jgi:hypothetical protein
VLRHEPRRLARLRLQLRQPRRQRHGSTPAGTWALPLRRRQQRTGGSATVR